MALTVGELRSILTADTRGLSSGLQRGRRSILGFERRAGASTDRTSASFRSLASVVAGPLTAALGGLSAFALGRQLLDLSENATLLRNRLRLVTGSAEEVNDVFGALRGVANRSRVSLEATGDLFFRIARSTGELGISQREVVDLTESISQTLAISGATAEEAQASLVQFGQGLASGELRGEELRSVLEQLPALAAELAAGLGISVGELREVGFAGELTATRLVEALQRRIPDIQRQFDLLAPTIGQAFIVARNEVFAVVDAFNEATGASDSLARGVITASRGIVSGFQAFAPVAIEATSAILSGLGDVVQVGELFGINLGNLQEAFRLLLDTANFVLRSIETGFRSVVNGAQTLRLALLAAGESFGLADAENVQRAFDDFEQSQNSLILSAEETEAAFSRLVDGFTEVDDTFRGTGLDDRLSQALENAAGGAEGLRARIEEAFGALSGADARISDDAPAGVEQRLTTQQSQQLEQIIALEARRNVERLRGIDPLLAQRQELQLQIDGLREIEGPQAVVEARDRVIAALRRDQLELTERQRDALEALPATLDEVRRRVADLAALDPEAAARFGDQVDQAIEDSIGTEAQREKLLELAREISQAVLDARAEAPTLGRSVAQSLREGVEEALTSGDALSAAEAFGAALRRSAAESLSSAFDDAVSGLSGLLDSVLPASLQSVAGPLTGLLGGVIGAALTDEQVSSSVGQARSAVTSAQQVRGVVAGPTDIAVAQVGRSIQDAFLESERLLAIIARNTAQVAQNTGGGADGASISGDESDLALANESASLF